MNLFNRSGYKVLVESLSAKGPRSYRLAYLQLRNMYGGRLTEKELHSTLHRVQLFESFWRKILDVLYGKLNYFYNEAVSLLSRLSPKEQLKRIQRDMPKLRQKAREIEARYPGAVPKLGKAEREEFIRRMVEKTPTRIPDNLKKRFEKEFNIHEGLFGLTGGKDPQALSTTGYVLKVIWATILYTIALSAHGVALSIPIVFLPTLIAALDDLQYQLTTKKYVTP